MRAMSNRRVERFVFLIHPLVWESNAVNPAFAAQYQEYLDYEGAMKKRWWRGIEEMVGRPHDALVVGSSAPPPELEEFAVSRLGDRALLMTDAFVVKNGFAGDRLSGEGKIGLGCDVLAMFRKYGFSWKSDELGHPVVCRMWVDRIKALLAERGVEFDPDTVESQAWGESFEGCASNYARYLGPYLRLRRPVEVVFEMTVPDFRVLFRAKYLGSVPLDRNVRLYLWDGEDGRQIARFNREVANVGDPTLYARFPTDTMQIEVRNYAQLLWPVNDSVASWADGVLKVPVWGGAAFPSVGGNHFIFARGVGPERFREAMSSAEFVEE